MSRSRKHQVATLLSLLVMFGVVACGDDTDPGEGPTSGSPDNLTTPGTALTVGETATVTRDGAGEVLEVTIAGIDRGSRSDLAALDLPAARGKVPFFVRYELQHVSGDSPYLPVNHFLSAWAGDTQLTQLAILEPFPVCQEKTFSADVAAGTTVEGCATFVIDKGDPPLDRVQFSYGEDYDSFDGHQISWEQ